MQCCACNQMGFLWPVPSALMNANEDYQAGNIQCIKTYNLTTLKGKNSHENYGE